VLLTNGHLGKLDERPAEAIRELFEENQRRLEVLRECVEAGETEVDPRNWTTGQLPPLPEPKPTSVG
jgi:hypothetical protein